MVTSIIHIRMEKTIFRSQYLKKGQKMKQNTDLTYSFLPKIFASGHSILS